MAASPWLADMGAKACYPAYGPSKSEQLRVGGAPCKLNDVPLLGIQVFRHGQGKVAYMKAGNLPGKLNEVPPLSVQQ